MSEIMRKILSEGTTPIMTDEGILQIFNYFYDRSKNKKQLYTLSGPSRIVRLTDSKDRIDNLDFDENAIRSSISKEMYRLFGTYFCGDIKEQRPFGQADKKEADDIKHGYDNRIYINAPFGEIRYKFIQLYAEKCKERGVACDGKFFHKNADEDSIDNMILYSSHKNINIYLEILEEIKTELPEFAECCGSPIASGLNVSYYALVHSGDNSPTYNDWFNEISEKAFDVIMAKFIINNDEFYKSLSREQREIIDIISSEESLKKAVLLTKNRGTRIGGLAGFGINTQATRVFREIVEQFVSTNPTLSQEDIVAGLRNEIETISSLVNFGDVEHKTFPISIKESDYLALGVEPSSIKTENKKTESKIKISKEQYLALLKADKSRVRFELAKMGLKAEIQGKSEEELKQMLFARIELDDESIIDILSGETEQLYQIVDLLGKDDEYKHRRDYEERFIELIGVDKVIDAAYSVRDKDAQLGRNRKWRFKDSLRSVRLARGKLIFESEEFQKLKTREQRNEFIKNFSEHAKYDVEEYYDLYGKSSTYSK